MRKLISLAVISFCFLLLNEDATSQVYQPNNDVDAVQVSGGIYMLRSNLKTGNPSVAASIGEDSVLLVDSSFAAFGDKLLTKIRALHGGKVRFIINTHWHGDHTEGNEFFGSDATIIARSRVRERLLTQGVLEEHGRLIAKQGLPVITFDTSFSIYSNGEEIKLYALPSGHTDGDAIIYFTKSNVVCVGDYFFVHRFPVIDVDGSGASLDGYMRNIKFITENFPTDAKIIPGHALFWPDELKVYTMADLRDYYAVLLESIGFVRQKIKAGKTLTQIQDEGLPEKFQSYGERPRFVPLPQWIETIYKSSVPAGKR